MASGMSTISLPRPAMRVVSTRTELFLLIVRLLFTAVRIMMISSGPCSVTGRRIHILPTELLATLPAPRTTTSRSYHKHPMGLEATGKDIVTGGVFEAPALTPRTLLCVVRHVYLFSSINRFAANTFSSEIR
jgi:hypothetical protein